MERCDALRPKLGSTGARSPARPLADSWRTLALASLPRWRMVADGGGEVAPVPAERGGFTCGPERVPFGIREVGELRPLGSKGRLRPPASR